MSCFLRILILSFLLGMVAVLLSALGVGSLATGVVIVCIVLLERNTLRDGSK